MSGCYNTPDIKNNVQPAFKVIGPNSSNQTWIYLCGLLNEFTPEYMDELRVLDVISKQLNIKFLVMIPTKRCLQLNNKLCWPHDTQEELLQVYKEVYDATKNYCIKGYIGFSNGGFFLNKLVQFIKIDKPIISIGSAGCLFNKEGPLNTIYLLIGKRDQWHYEHATNFYNQSKDTNLTIYLTEYDEGHQIPEHILADLITNLSSKSMAV